MSHWHVIIVIIIIPIFCLTALTSFSTWCFCFRQHETGFLCSVRVRCLLFQFYSSSDPWNKHICSKRPHPTICPLVLHKAVCSDFQLSNTDFLLHFYADDYFLFLQEAPWAQDKDRLVLHRRQNAADGRDETKLQSEVTLQWHTVLLLNLIQVNEMN